MLLAAHVLVLRDIVVVGTSSPARELGPGNKNEV